MKESIYNLGNDYPQAGWRRKSTSGGGDKPTPKDFSKYTDKAGNKYTAKKVGDVYISEQNYYYNDGGVGIYNFLGASEEVGLAYTTDAIARIEIPEGWHILGLKDLDKLGLRFKSNADATKIYTYDELMELSALPSSIYLMEYKEDTDSYIQLTDTTAKKLGILYITNGRYKPSDGKVSYGPDTDTPQYNQYLSDTSNGMQVYLHKYAYNGEGYICGIRGEGNNYGYQIQLVHD